MNKKCYICQEVKQANEFSWKNKKQGIRNSMCLSCKREYSREHYQKNSEQYKKNLRRRRLGGLAWINEYKESYGCAVCEEDNPLVLQFHHPFGEREQTVSSLAGCSIETIKKEIAKCIVLCANCHKKEHPKKVFDSRAHIARREYWFEGFKETVSCQNCGVIDSEAISFCRNGHGPKRLVTDLVSSGYSIENILKAVDESLILCANCRILHYADVAQ